MASALWPVATFPVVGARRTATPCVSLAFNPTPRHSVDDGHATWLRPLVPAILWAATAAEAAEEEAAAEATAGGEEEAAAEATAGGEAEANSNEAARAPPDAAASRRFRKVSTLPPNRRVDHTSQRAADPDISKAADRR